MCEIEKEMACGWLDLIRSSGSYFYEAIDEFSEWINGWLILWVNEGNEIKKKWKKFGSTTVNLQTNGLLHN